MLRKIRITLAIVFYVCITLMFLDFTGVTHAWFGWMAKIQFLPALLALNVGVIALLVVLSLVFGRIYCSVICPMGVFQDIVAWLSRHIGNKKKRNSPYFYSPAKSWLRYGFLGILIVAIITGLGSLVALLAPYSSYGRISSNLLQPLYRWGNNLLASFAEHYGSYAIYDVDVWLKTLPTFIIAVATVIIVVALAAKNGRTYCNTVCPVGTILGFISRFSIFQIRFDVDKCKNCGMCSKGCKAACIDGKNHIIDYSRCVACGDCLGKCKFGGLKYAPAKPSLADAFPKTQLSQVVSESSNTVQKEGKAAVDKSLRVFLSAIAAGTAATAMRGQNIPKAKDVKMDGGLAPIADRVKPMLSTPIVPPGALSAKNMSNHCTGCQLCVSACPNGVLRPSTDIFKLMQPEMAFDRGYCRPECTKCADVCPAGAIKPITTAEKSAIKVGRAVWIKEQCLPFKDGQECGNCSRHCPTNAIEMVAIDPNNPKSLKMPAINDEKCIGCGTCEYLCPSRPIGAIYVEGIETHRKI